MESTQYSLRRARPEEAKAIHRLTYAVRNNPLNLDWRRFCVAVDPNGKILGCGQVKEHRDGSRELASIAVWLEYRGQGIATAVILALLAEHPERLYLTCRGSMGAFYQRFGFRTAESAELPPYFRRVQKAFRFMKRFIQIEDLLVMVRDGDGG